MNFEEIGSLLWLQFSLPAVSVNLPNRAGGNCVVDCVAELSACPTHPSASEPEALKIRIRVGIRIGEIHIKIRIKIWVRISELEFESESE